MSTLLVWLTLLSLVQGGGPASAPVGNPTAGKALWEGPNAWCRNCHGTKGEGGYGPDLAGRKLSLAQFGQAVRKPWGVMPAFVDSQISDQDIADFAAYFASLPALDQPGPWRFPVPTDAPRGQQLALGTAGCAQCHGPTLDAPRAVAGAVGADFEWLKRMVYTHTTEMPEHFKLVGQDPSGRLRMGNFSPARVPESVLLEIFNWAKDLGFRVPVTGQLSAGQASANGTTYTLNVTNGGLIGKGLTAEELTVLLFLPEGSSVVSTTGAGYQGVRRDEAGKANAAVWQVAKLAPKDRQTFTVTLSKAGTAENNLRGAVRWLKPEKKPGPGDTVNIAPAPLP